MKEETFIFYAFYEAENLSLTAISKTPLVIWLHGGPGCSSMIRNFYELGQESHIQSSFFDNPIGTGFSIASTPEELPRDQEVVARHMFIAISKFIALDSHFRSRPLYITGESYAGKYVPSVGYYILKKILHLPFSKWVNLYGLAIGNGLTDPITQVGTHALHNYNLGLINEKQKIHMEKLFLVNVTGRATFYDFTIQSP